MSSDAFGLVGSVIDRRYRVDAVVGEGGFGVVYKGFHLAFKHAVAVKCLKVPSHFTPEAKSLFADRFREEGAFLSKLSEHRSIVRVFDLDVTSTPLSTSVPYLVLEWLEGEDLEQMLTSRRARGNAAFREAHAIALLRPAIDAVAWAHSQKIAHRDLKPANLFEARSHQGDAVLKVLDFGIAKAMQDGDSATQLSTRTSSGFSAFSPPYGAPEQFRAKRYGPTGPWTDVHALGLILTELVTGERALTGEEQIDFFESATAQTRPTPRARGAAVSDAFEAVCQRALAVQPKDRFGTAAELRAALDALTDGEERRPSRTVFAEPLANAPEDSRPETQHAESAPPSHDQGGERRERAPSQTRSPQLARHGPVVIAALVAAVGAGGYAIFRVATRPETCEPDLNACIERGVHLLEGDGVPKDAKRAAELFSDACDRGQMQGCYNLAVLYGSADGVKLDEARASKLFEKACDGGHADGCTALGWAYLNAAGVAPNVDRARDLFSRACNGGDARACTKLGVMVGSGKSADEGRAAELYAKGCDGGDLMGCVQLGRCYENGNGVKQEPDRARANFQKACDGGESSGCEALPHSSSGRPSSR